MKKIVLSLCIMILLMFAPGLGMSVHAEIKPEIVLNSYELNEKMEYGEKTSIYVVFANESSLLLADNILVTYTSPNGTVIPAYGTSNQFFIKSIQPGAAVGVQIPIVILESESGYGDMKFQLEYSTEMDALYTSNSEIVFPLNESGSLSIKNINITSNTTVGANSLIGVGYTNGKKDELHNVKLIIEGDISEGTKEILIGDIGAGQSKYSECYVTYEMIGENNVNVHMYYEDDRGNEYTVDGGEYTVTVKNTAQDDNQTSDGTSSQMTPQINQPEQNMNLSTLFLLGAAVIIMILIILVIISLVKRK